MAFGLIAVKVSGCTSWMWHVALRASAVSSRSRSFFTYKDVSDSSHSLSVLSCEEQLCFMSSQTLVSTPSRPLDHNEGIGSPQYPRRAHAQPVNIIPARRIWSRGPPMFYANESSGSSQGSSSTKSGGDSSTPSDGPERRRVHTVSPYGSFFVEDMDIDTPVDIHSPSRGGGWTRGRSAALNRALYQTSAGRPTSSRQGHSRQQSSMGPGQFELADPTYFGMRGALPVMPGRNAPREEHPTPSTLTTSTHRSQPTHPISRNREYHRDEANSSPHNSQARPSRVAMGAALPPSSTDRQKPRGMAHTTRRR